MFGVLEELSCIGEGITGGFEGLAAKTEANVAEFDFDEEEEPGLADGVGVAGVVGSKQGVSLRDPVTLRILESVFKTVEIPLKLR